MVKGQIRKQTLLARWVLWNCSVAMQLFVPLKASAFGLIINTYPNTLKSVDAGKLAKTLVDGYAACLEIGDVEEASHIARVLMQWSKYRQVFQRKFAAEICRRSSQMCINAVVKFKNRTTASAAERYGALSVYEALKDLDEMGYEVKLELLHATALMVEARERGHTGSTLSDAAMKEWNRRAGFAEGPEALFDKTGKALKEQAKRRLASGRKGVVTGGQVRFLLGRQSNINPTAS